MPTPITVKNIGLVDDSIDGTIVAPGDTLVVDADDANVQKELRSDPDRSWLVLPDSAAGTLPASAAPRLIDADFVPVHVGDGATDGDVPVDLPVSIDYEGDGVSDIVLTATLNRVQYLPDTGSAMEAQVLFTQDGNPIQSVGLDSKIADYERELPITVSAPIGSSSADGAHTYGVAVVTNGAAHQLQVSPFGEAYVLSLDEATIADIA